MLTFYDNRDEALTDMHAYNRTHPKGDPRVVVPGPEDNWAVMDLADAIEAEFLYEWTT